MRSAGKTGRGSRIHEAQDREVATPRSPATRAVCPVPNVASASLGELVPDAVDGQHVARVSWIRLELAPQVLDVCVDGAVERLDLDPADPLQKLRAREHAPGLPPQ